MKALYLPGIALIVALANGSATASVITLDFEPETAAAIQAAGGDPGLGVTYVLNSLGRTNILPVARNGSGYLTFDGGISADYSLFGSSLMNVAAGFETGLSFFYNTYNSWYRQDVPYVGTGEVEVFSGLDGTGTSLASFSFLPRDPEPDASASDPFRSVGLSFTGVARSILIGRGFTTTFDNLTFGSTNIGLTGGVDRASVHPNEILSFDRFVSGQDVGLVEPVVTPLPASLPFLLAGLLPVAALRLRRRG